VTDVIVASGLTKRFGGTTALDGLDLRARAGEVHGFLGPNGAGKSTTLRALLGLVRLDAGSAQVLGHDPWRDTVALHRRLAYVPGEVTLWPNLTGGEAVDVLLRLRGITPERSHRDELLERFDLDPTKRCRAYSKGNRQKLLLVAALATDVDLLLLDEPTAGLDPLVCETFAELVMQRVADGAAVLLSSHVLSEVEELADRVTIIRDGRCVETGTLGELRHLRATRVRAQLPEPAPPLQAVHGLVGVHDLQVDGSRLTCTVDSVALAPLLAALSEAGVTELTSEPPSLEQLFLDAYRPAAPVGAP
jgi:ABC-2 type transport system ATP-binding protein